MHSGFAIIKPKFQPVLPPTSCLILGKPLHFFDLQFNHLKNIANRILKDTSKEILLERRRIVPVSEACRETLSILWWKTSIHPRPPTMPSGAAIPLFCSIDFFFKSFPYFKAKPLFPLLPWTTLTEPTPRNHCVYHSHSFVSRFRKREHTALIKVQRAHSSENREVCSSSVAQLV